MTAPSPSRRSSANSSRRYSSPAAVPTRGRPRPTSAARKAAAGGALRTGRVGRTAPPPAPVSGGGGLALTTRAALLGLALCAVVLTLAYPAREYLAQHRQVNSLAAQVASDRKQVQQLRAAGQRDADPAYVEQQARLRLHMQNPGDVVLYLPPPPVPKVGKQTAGSVHTPVLPGRGSQPWYSQLYRSTVVSGK